MARGILGQFETLKHGIPYPCMTGDIASVAGLTVHEPDDGVVHFAKWTPFDQDAVSCSAVSSPAREEDGAGRRGAEALVINPSDRHGTATRSLALDTRKHIVARDISILTAHIVPRVVAIRV